MKKSIKKLMLILGVASAVAGLTACGNTQQGEHSTDYSSYVSNGSLGHSGVYADGSIDYKYSYAHVWGNDECSLCGQKSTGKEEEKPTPPPVTPVQKDVGKIEIEANPTKMKYWIGETFSPEGGSVKITYKDGTTEVKPMTDEIFTHNDVKTNSVGRKTVTITLGGQKASFTITVQQKGYDVTFDYNYSGAPAAEVVTAASNAPVDELKTPERSGYTFYKWYTDADCTVEYDFNNVVTAPITLYGDWKENGSTYYEFTYDYNYYGIKLQSYSHSVKSGEAARQFGLNPQRAEFSFDGWYTDAECTAAYNKDTAISQNTTVYAKWIKTKTSATTYVFEGELTNLDGKEGPGLSGSAAGKAMVIADVKNLGASGGKYISYLYKEGLSVDFEIACSEEVTNATLTVRLSSEFNFNLNSGMYTIELNGAALSYDAVNMTSGMQYDDVIVINNVHLNKGANTIKLITSNSTNPAGEGMGTYRGTAPTVDCIKITTDAVITWDETKGLPKDNS